MANMHIVTGYAGEAHITAADHGALNAAVFGAGEYVLTKGNQLAASVITSNTVRVLDGDIMMQGRYARLNEGKYVDLIIENGTRGTLRNDLIVARYTKNATTGVEEINLVVIKGTAVSSDPVDPEYTTGNIIEDYATVNDMPLYRIPLVGLTVGELVPLFEKKETVGYDVVPIEHGGTGATSKEDALSKLGAASVNYVNSAYNPNVITPSVYNELENGKKDYVVSLPCEPSYAMLVPISATADAGEFNNLVVRYYSKSSGGYVYDTYKIQDTYGYLLNSKAFEKYSVLLLLLLKSVKAAYILNPQITSYTEKRILNHSHGISGGYTGTDVSSRSIDLGFQPRILIITGSYNSTYSEEGELESVAILFNFDELEELNSLSGIAFHNCNQAEPFIAKCVLSVEYEYLILGDMTNELSSFNSSRYVYKYWGLPL